MSAGSVTIKNKQKVNEITSSIIKSCFIKSNDPLKYLFEKSL